MRPFLPLILALLLLAPVGSACDSGAGEAAGDAICPSSDDPISRDCARIFPGVDGYAAPFHETGNAWLDHLHAGTHLPCPW